MQLRGVTVVCYIACEIFGVIAMFHDFLMESAGERGGGVARAAFGIINRNVLGKTRHIESGILWTQKTAAQQRQKNGKNWRTVTRTI